VSNYDRGTKFLKEVGREGRGIIIIIHTASTIIICQCVSNTRHKLIVSVALCAVKTPFRSTEVPVGLHNSY
jgi:hypothetical protein